MAEYNAPATLASGAYTFLFNRSSDVGFHDPDKCSGLDMAQVRATIEDKPRASGGIVYDALLGPRHIVLAGTIVTSTLATRNLFEKNLITILTYMLTNNGTYQWLSSDGITRTVTGRCEIGAEFPGKWLKSYVFGLVCADPTLVET